jgi:GTP-binding protein HflX
MRAEANEKPINAIVAAVQLPNVSDIEFESSLAELRDLAKTLGFEIVATFTQKR